MKCSDCNSFYIKQTGRLLIIRYNEFTKVIKQPHIKTNFGEYIFNWQHDYNNIQYTKNPYIIQDKKRPKIEHITTISNIQIK